MIVRLYEHTGAPDRILVSFDKNYSKLTCKLYQLDNQSWKNLQEFDLELSGDTFWFLVPDSLLEATVFYKNVNVEQQYSTISTGRPFETIEPSFGIHGVTSHYASTDSVNGQLCASLLTIHAIDLCSDIQFCFAVQK